MYKTNQDLVKENTLLRLENERLKRERKEIENKATEKVVLGF